jgi:hypothetical protein
MPAQSSVEAVEEHIEMRCSTRTTGGKDFIRNIGTSSYSKVDRGVPLAV